MSKPKEIHAESVQIYSMAFARKLKNDTVHFKGTKLEDLAAAISSSIKLLVKKDVFNLNVKLIEDEKRKTENRKS